MTKTTHTRTPLTRMLSHSLLLIALVSMLSACGRTIEWKQEVMLHDGRVILLDRQSKLGPKQFPENVSLENEQTLSFQHPDSGARIEWTIPRGLQPVALDFLDGIPFYLLQAYTVSDYNKWGCPNPPYILYQYQDAQWKRIEFSALPSHFNQRNVLPMSKYIKDITTGRTISTAEVEAVVNRRRINERTISREKTNPIAKGCDDDVLVHQGRQSEIDYRR